MNNLDKLIEEIQNNALLARIKNVEEKLKENLPLQKKISNFQAFQRSLVQANKSNINQNEQYNKMKEEILSEYLMIEYFNAVEEINELISLISNTISFNL